MNEIPPALRQARLYFETGQWDACCQELSAQPELQMQWGLQLAQASQWQGAEIFFRALLNTHLNTERHPPLIAQGAVHNLGLCYFLQNQLSQAESCFRQALQIPPASSESHFQLGLLLHDSHRWDEALEHYRQAWLRQPGRWEACQNGCQILLDTGQPDAAVAWLEAACALPDCPQELWQLLRFYLQAVSADPQRQAAIHQSWEARFMRPLYPAPAPRAPRPFVPKPAAPDRRLRVGYLSGDFGHHSATNTYSALFEYADRRRFELHLFSTRSQQNHQGRKSESSSSNWFRAQADSWHAIAGLSETDLAEYLQAQDLDILVDLSGLTGGHRLGVLARQMVPIQLTGFGFGCSTGLSCLQGRVTDLNLSPPEDPGWNSEPLLYLSQVFHWFPTALHHKALLTPPPSLARGAPQGITLGCGNNPFKFSQACLETWGHLLQSLPHSRLLLKFSGLELPHIQALLSRRLERCGIPVEKVRFLGHSSLWEHLHFYNQLDLCLDPFPYQGGVSTCEALWMGVPVLSLSGGTRAANSILTPLGLSDWLTPNPESYLHTGLSLAQAPEVLSFWRQALRPRLAASVLCQGIDYCREVEALYLRLWQAQSRVV